jgi:galactokinase
MESPSATLDDSATGWTDVFQCGRVCLFGEHSDWAGGHRAANPEIVAGRTLVCGTNSGLHARFKLLPSNTLVLRTRDDKEHVHGPVTVAFNEVHLRQEAKEGSFWSYACGTVAAVLSSFKIPEGQGLAVDIYKMDLPLKKGLSSSAAVCVLMARCMSEAFGLGLDTPTIMDLAYRGERLTPSMCGRMDQACAYRDVPVQMTYDGEDVSVSTLKVGAPVHLVLVDLCAKKDTVEILSSLQSCFPFAKNEDEENLQKLLGPINHEITGKAIQALEEGDVERIGKLMTEAQALFDRYAGKICPSQLTAPVLHKVLSHPALAPHVHGGKGVGAGGDGTAQFVAKSEEDQGKIIDILQRDFEMPAFAVTIKPTVVVA